MSIAQAERLKAELTDKYVVVSEGVPELRRFAGLTGTVKTVNMSCRALVQFDGPVDISWYDIDPAYLQVVTAPQPKKAEAKHEAKSVAASPAKPAGATPAVAKPAGQSPLDAIRAAGAAKPAAATPAAGGAKPSPLDMIRKQAAAKAAGESAPVAEKPAPEVKAPASAAGGAKLSPMEQIRQQAAAKAAGAAPSASTPAPVAVAAAPVAPAAAPPEVKAPVVPAAPAPSAAGRPKSTAEVLAAIRKQGGNK